MINDLFDMILNVSGPVAANLWIGSWMFCGKWFANLFLNVLGIIAVNLKVLIFNVLVLIWLADLWIVAIDVLMTS